MKRTLEDLPDDCWAVIVSQLKHHHLESLSLVSKSFMLITNRVRGSLKVVNSSREIVSKQLQRFPNLQKIDLSYSVGSLQESLHEIASSQVDLKELNISRKDNPNIALLKKIGSQMKNLKVFRCSYSYLTDDYLISMVDYFSSIEELDISQQYYQEITDEGIISLSKKLKRLQRIDLSGNGKISDHSLLALSINCKFLKKVVLRHCPCVSQIGISFLMGNSLRYNSLIIESTHKNPLIFDTFSYSKQITTVEFSSMKISNNILNNIANAKLPLKKFCLSFCTGFTIDGLLDFMKVYNSLEYLALDGTNFLTDECFKCLSPYISKLVSFNLNSCFKLTISSFITIALACPIIQHIEIVLSSSSDKQRDSEITIVNCAIKSALLTCTSKTLERVLPMCPDLEALNVTTLVQSNELDIAYIVQHCGNIRHLGINHSEKIIFNGKYSKEGEGLFTCKLESLSARKSRIDDQLLENVGINCPKLLSLDLQGCMSVTEKRVRNLVEKCERIRYINLNQSIKADKPLVAWMVDLCPSLRQIVVPYPFEKDQSNGFLIQGCFVHPGMWEERFCSFEV